MDTHRTFPALAFMAIFFVPSLIGAAFADQITVDGKTYRDVLINKGRSMYYVRLPQEGRVINIALSKVDETTVSISDDPYYRDDLKDLFQENLERVRAGENLEASNLADPSAFKVLPQDQGSPGGLAFGGSRGPGLGVTRAQVQQVAQSMRITFGPIQGNVLNGKNSDGSITFQVTGPPEGVTEIVLKVSVDPQNPMASMTSMQSLGPLLARIAPWSNQWMMQSLAGIMQGNPSEKTQAGVLLRLQPSAQDPTKISLTFTLLAV